MAEMRGTCLRCALWGVSDTVIGVWRRCWSQIKPVRRRSWRAWHQAEPDLPFDMRPDSCYHVDQHPRRAVELAIPLAGNGRRGGVTRAAPRFEVRAGVRPPAFPHDSRSWAVAGWSRWSTPTSQWQLQAQVLRWRGDTARGGQIRGVGVLLPSPRYAPASWAHR